MDHKDQPITIIPKPQALTQKEGRFTLGETSSISCEGEGAEEVAELLADYLRPATGFSFPVTRGPTAGTIHLQAAGTARPDGAGFVNESYALTTTENGVQLKAETAAGLARAIQTLRQLLPPGIMCTDAQKSEWILPLVEIVDAPRFRWRGQHLDVCRHFFSVQEVCRMIDLVALHRLNICHLHLTEDQGWRIEIKKYPRLTEVGSRRDATLIGDDSDRPRQYDNTPYGGFFTQEDIKTIVRFAERRHITLVPEIDMPGHMVAAIAAYPELGNFKNETRVRCHWGVSQNVLNMEESTVAFMKDVLTEVMDLFPGRFIHVGGDEAPKHEWSESQRAQNRMAELGLQNEFELQSWFIREMDEHISAAGRRLIGWDEILEGGLARNAAVMSWRGEAGGIAAASQQHDVVMTPDQWTYFNLYQAEPKKEEPRAFNGMLPLDLVYSYDPIPEAMREEDRQYVMGGQGQLWTEYIADMNTLEYMGFPRICALAEVLWLDENKKNYVDFLNRLAGHRARLDALKVNTHPRP